MARLQTWSQPTRRKDGHVGAHLKLSVRGEGGADGHYRIDSHGLTSDQVAAEVERIHSFHEQRAGRMNGFRAIQAAELAIGGATYRVVDLIVRYPVDAAYCALYVDVRQVVDDVVVRVAGFPMRRLYKSAAELPDDATIVAMVTAAIPAETDDLGTLHEEFIGKVAQKISAKLSREKVTT